MEDDRRITDYWKQLETGTALKPITILGHSYGGAIATLCKEQLWHDLPFMRDNIRLVTFGSPRVIGWLNWWKIKHRWDNSTVYRNGVIWLHVFRSSLWDLGM